MSRTMTWRDTNPLNLTTAAHDVIVTAYAAVSCMDEMLYTHTARLDAWDDDNIRPVRKEVDERLKALAALYYERFGTKCLDQWLYGNPNDNDGQYPEVSNYDVEDDLRKNLGTDGISYDSESGWFVLHCTTARRDEVVAYLQKNHPYMEFEVDKEELEDIRPPMITSWTVAAIWMKERNLTATIVLPTPEPKTGRELDELLDDARSALLRTGLTLKEAVKLL